MALAISAGGAMVDFSGKNQDAASFNRFTNAFMHCVYSRSLSNAFVALVNDFSFCGFICFVHDADWSAAWN